MGWTSPMQPLLTSDHSPIGTEPMTMDTIAWLGSINYLGSIVGSFLWGPAADQLGRKRASSLVAIPYIFSWLLVLTARSTTWLLVARLVVGIGNSGSTVNVPVFIAEIAQDDLRGFLGSFFSISVCIGVLFAFVVGTYFQYFGLAFSCLVVPVLYFLTFVWLPETPMFLWKSGMAEKAADSLMWYRGGDIAEVDKALSKYKSIPTNNGRTKKPSLKSLVATRGTKKAMILGVALMIAVQGSGIFPIVNFAVSIFEMCGTSLTPYESAIILGSMQLISSVLCSMLVDRLGRKILVVGSQIIMTISLSLLGLYLFYFTTPPDSVLSWTPIVLLSLHIVAFAGGLGAVAFIIVGEIFPPEVRGLAMSQLSLVTGVCAFLVIKLFPTLKDILKPHGVFLLYSLSCLVLCIFFSFNLPETKNIPQSVILKMLNGEELTKDEVASEAKPLRELRLAPIVRTQSV